MCDSEISVYNVHVSCIELRRAMCENTAVLQSLGQGQENVKWSRTDAAFEPFLLAGPTL